MADKLLDKGKKQNWFLRHKVISIILVLFILFVIVVASAGNKGSKSGSNIANNVSSTAAAKEQKTTIPGQAAYKINDSVTVGKFTYKVTKVETKSSVGNQYSKEDASGIYQIVYITLLNNDKEFRYADSNMFKLMDDKGRSFVVSTEATMAHSAANGGKLDFFLKQVNPGVEISGVLIFDIPKDAQ